MKTLFRKESEKLLIIVSLSEDEMKLFIEVSVKDPHLHDLLVEKGEILQMISPPLDSARLDHDIIKDIAERLSRKETTGERRIAKGRGASPGRDGKILWLIKPYRGELGMSQRTTNDSVDIRELHLFDNVVTGAIVGRIYPPHLGENGETALGKPIKAQSSKPATLKIDKTLIKIAAKEHEYEEIVAQQDGVLVEQAGIWKIADVLKISKDLDLRFGNLDFIGSIEISGDVSPGLLVKGVKGVRVSGNLQHAYLTSTSGQVIVDGFATGDQGGHIVATKGVQVSVAHKLMIESGSLVTIKKAALDCVIRSQGVIFAQNAQIVGGRILLVAGADIGILGNDAGINTELVICSSVEATSDFTKLLSEIASHMKAVELVELHLGPYAHKSSRISNLKDPLRKKIEVLLEKRDLLSRSLGVLEERRKKLLSDGLSDQIVRVNIRKVLYPGVVIRAGEDLFSPKDMIKGPVSIEYSRESHTFESKPIVEFEISKDLKKGGRNVT